MNFSPVLTGTGGPGRRVDAPQAVSLVIEPGLTRHNDSLREVAAMCMHQQGIGRVASQLNEHLGNLSSALSGQNQRRLSVDTLEAYIEAFDDPRPIYYLIERFLLTSERKAEDAHRVQVLSQVQALMASLER